MVTLTWYVCKYKVHNSTRGTAELQAKDVPGGVMYLVFTCMPGENYCRRLIHLWSYVPCIYTHARWELP